MRFGRLTVLVVGVVAGIGATLVAVSTNQSTRRHVNLASHVDSAPYRDAVLAGNSLYLAGRFGLDPTTTRPPADATEAVGLILEGMTSLLGDAGLTMNDLVSVLVYCAHVAVLETFKGVYRSNFSREFPARAFIGSAAALRRAF
jgi:enamine deaminase RidA (YjgF/YER057c/UK114 family)